MELLKTFAEQLKTNEKTLRKTTRDLERDRNKMEREEKKLVGLYSILSYEMDQPASMARSDAHPTGDQVMGSIPARSGNIF